jgi:hypothetical protein
MKKGAELTQRKKIIMVRLKIILMYIFSILDVYSFSDSVVGNS